MKHSGFERRFVHGVRTGVPTAENKVVGIRQGDEILDERVAVLVALPEPDGLHLGERPHGPPQTSFEEFHSRDESARDRSHARQEYAELAADGFEMNSCCCRLS